MYILFNKFVGWLVVSIPVCFLTFTAFGCSIYIFIFYFEYASFSLNNNNKRC